MVDFQDLQGELLDFVDLRWFRSWLAFAVDLSCFSSKELKALGGKMNYWRQFSLKSDLKRRDLSLLDSESVGRKQPYGGWLSVRSGSPIISLKSRMESKSSGYQVKMRESHDSPLVMIGRKIKELKWHELV